MAHIGLIFKGDFGTPPAITSHPPGPMQILRWFGRRLDRLRNALACALSPGAPQSPHPTNRDPSAMKERRRAARRMPPEILKIHDLNTGAYLGQVANLTPDGLLLIAQDPIRVHTVFQLEIVLEFPVDGVATLRFGAESVWSSQAAGQQGYCWVGFSIIDISRETADFIDAWSMGWNEAD
jgi:hypothetical protein